MGHIIAVEGILHERDTPVARRYVGRVDANLTGQGGNNLFAPIAEEVGNPKVGNMVMLGAYVAGTKILKPETIEAMIQEMFAGPKAKFIPLNIEAFRRGMACIS